MFFSWKTIFDDFYFSEILCPIDLALTFISPHGSSSRDRWDDFKDVILLENDQLLRRFVLRRS